MSCMATLRQLVYDCCTGPLAKLSKVCPERRIPLLKRVLDVLDYAMDPMLFTYVYISVHAVDPNDDDILWWHDGPRIDSADAGVNTISDDHPLHLLYSDLIILTKYSWEMLGVSAN